MNLGKTTFRLAVWLLEKGGHCEKGEGYKRVRKGLSADFFVSIRKGTVVEMKCPSCYQEFRYEMPSDNAPVKIYCSSRCSKTAALRRNSPSHVKYCASPEKNRYPNMESAVAVMKTMKTDDSWRLNAYPCPVGHWHIGRAQGKIVSTPDEKEN